MNAHVTLDGSVRRAIEDEIERLISLLDLMEADSEDMEDGADAEPSLGWTERGGQSFLAATAPNGYPCDTADLEFDNCDDEDGHDAEGGCPDDDGEHIMWPDDMKSQEVLVTL